MKTERHICMAPMINDNTTVTYNDANGCHITLAYDSARIEIFHDFEPEKDRFTEAYILYEKVSMCDSPVMEQFDDRSKLFNYSPLLFKFSKYAGTYGWDKLGISNPVIKIVSDRKSLSGQTVESSLVDLIEMVGESNSALAFYISRKLSASFLYIMPDIKERMVASVFDKAYPKPKQAVATSPIDDNARLLKEERERMRDWLRAGNRW